jgi:esterase/lipase superfamily enzyme
MGNRGLLRALQRLAADAELRAGVKFGQIFLAAPDVDRDLFLSLAHLYPQFSDRTTLYASDGDKAVAMSAWLHFGPRAGYFPPVTVAQGVERLDTVAVPDFDLDLLGHSYFAQAEALLHDMFDLIRHGTPPAQRQRLAWEGGHWAMRR